MESNKFNKNITTRGTADNELGKPENNPNIKESYIVAFDAFEKKETIHFSLNVPGNNSTLYLESNTYFREETELEGLSLVFDVWGGSISGPRQTGSFMLVRSGQGLVSGFLQFNGTSYAFQPIDFGVSLLQETRVVNPHLTCGTNSPVESGFNSISQSTSPFCDPPPPEFQCRKQWVILDCWSQGLVDSLYEKYSAYSHPFYNLDAYYVTQDKIQGRLSFLQLLANNNITGINITWYGLNVDYPNLYTGNITNDRLTFQQQASQLYSTYQQDRAILSTHGDYGNVYGEAEIPVSSSGYNASLDDAAITVHWYVNGPRFTYAHELGHLMGARHDNIDPTNDPLICAHGYKSAQVITLMSGISSAEILAGESRILFLSNPDQNVGGNFIGTNNRNNKIVVHNVLCDNIYSSGVSVKRKILDLSDENNVKINMYPNPMDDLLTIVSRIPFFQVKIISIDGFLLEDFIMEGMVTNFKLKMGKINEEVIVVQVFHANGIDTRTIYKK